MTFYFSNLYLININMFNLGNKQITTILYLILQISMSFMDALLIQYPKL